MGNAALGPSGFGRVENILATAQADVVMPVAAVPTSDHETCRLLAAHASGLAGLPSQHRIGELRRFAPAITPESGAEL